MKWPRGDDPLSPVQQSVPQREGNLSRKRRFSDSQSSCFPANVARVGHSPTDYSETSQLAEAFACTIDEPCESDILELISLLPTEVPARGTMHEGAHSFTTGAFSKDGATGLRRNCVEFPRTTAALTRFVRKRAPALEFGAVAVFTNLEADFHMDTNNCPASRNWVHPLSNFKEEESGSRTQGVTLCSGPEASKGQVPSCRFPKGQYSLIRRSSTRLCRGAMANGP